MKIGSYELQVPFVTTSADNVKHLLTILDHYKQKQTEPLRVIDLGSGDGRVVLEFAKAGAIVHGYEIKPDLVQRSRVRISEAGLTDNAAVFEKSFWDTDLSNYDLVYIYGMQSILGRLEEKLGKELKPNAVFISNIFRLPHWKPKKTYHNLHIYHKQ